MPLANVHYPTYYETFKKMLALYHDKIELKLGLEFGMQAHTIEKYEKLFARFPFDFIILSVHEVEDKEFWTQDFQRGRTQKEYNERYYEELLYLVENYHNYSVLVNTSSYRYGLSDLTPSRDILKLYWELGEQMITIGSDSHKPEHLGTFINETKQELKALGFKKFCTFDKMQPIYHQYNKCPYLPLCV